MQITSPPVTPDPAGDLAFLREQIEKPKENQVTKQLAKHIDKVWQQNQADFKAVRRQMVNTLDLDVQWVSQAPKD